METPDPSFQKNVIESIYANKVNWAIIFHPQPNFCDGEFEGFTPFVSVYDIHAGLFIIRGADLRQYKGSKNLIINNQITNIIGAGGVKIEFNQLTCPILVEYKNLDELVNDGWTVDHQIMKR